MRALGFLAFLALFAFAPAARAAHVTDHADLALDIDAPGTTACHFTETGPVDASGCNAAERVTLGNMKQLEPNAIAALVFHFSGWQASITLTRAAPMHSMSASRVTEDLAAYQQGMHDRMAGTQVQIVEAPRFVRAPNGLQIIVSVIRNASVDTITRALEIRARNATYRVLFSAITAHGPEIAAMAERTLKTIVARPALTFAEDVH